MIAWFGIPAALIAIGLLCPFLAVLSVRRLRKMDRSVVVLDVDIGLLQRVPMFDPLPLPAIEQLARGLESLEVPAGRAVVTEGEIGNRYYVIESGEADVLGDGRIVATLGPGEGFGEIALLRSTRRTATVVARSSLTLRALGSDRFISAVMGYTPSAHAAAAGVEDQLGRYAPNEPLDEGPSSS
jgi:CRP-like cAMP-binding protein